MINSTKNKSTEAFPMNKFNKDVQNALLGKGTNLKELFRAQLEETVNQLLKSELPAVLGYENYERDHQSDNARNGSYDHQIDTEFGTINIQIPCDRQNKFQNAILKPCQGRFKIVWLVCTPRVGNQL